MIRTTHEISGELVTLPDQALHTNGPLGALYGSRSLKYKVSTARAYGSETINAKLQIITYSR